LAEKLVQIAPKGLTKVFYSDNGSTAVEVALKIAFQYWQQVSTKGQGSRGKGKEENKKKTKFITLANAYHGDTVGSVSLGGMDLFHKIYKPLLFKAFKVKPDLAAVENIMQQHHQGIAAMIVEPLIQGAAGMLLQPKGFLKGVRRLCNKYQVLLICDEVATGFGRTGKMFACEHERVCPDIMCVAKGLTGGYLPVAATLTTDKIYQAFLGTPAEQKTFYHGHTYTGNPLGCAAALANLAIFKKEQTLKKLIPKIKYLRKRLKAFKPLKQVVAFRQLGFMVGIDLKSSVNMQNVMLGARKGGAILRPLGNTVVLMPPLTISHQELAKLLDITYSTIEAA
jgi:adenosylmethionine-8-amino-7-oxononanoate aminotransferase